MQNHNRRLHGVAHVGPSVPESLGPRPFAAVVTPCDNRGSASGNATNKRIKLHPTPTSITKTKTITTPTITTTNTTCSVNTTPTFSSHTTATSYKTNTMMYTAHSRRKRPRRCSALGLMSLPIDALHTIIAYLMDAPRDNDRFVITTSGLLASLPFAMSCRGAHKIWTSSLQNIDVSLSHRMNDQALASLCRSASSSLLRLTARRCHQLTTTGLLVITRYCPMLRALDLSHTSIDDTGLAAILKTTAGSLVSLAVHACNNVTRGGVNAIAHARPPALSFLDIGGLQDVNDSTLTHVVTSIGASLRTLIVSACKRLTDVSLNSIAFCCFSLSSLTMRSLPAVTDAGLQTLCASRGHQLHILDLLDCTSITRGGYLTTIRRHCPHIFRHLYDHSQTITPPTADRSLRDCIIATMPGLIYRISATDAVRRLPALYFLLLDESALRTFRVAVQGRSLNLSDFGSVLVSNFGRRPTRETRAVLRSRFGHDSAFDADSDDDSCALRVTDES